MPVPPSRCPQCGSEAIELSPSVSLHKPLQLKPGDGYRYFWHCLSCGLGKDHGD